MKNLLLCIKKNIKQRQKFILIEKENIKINDVVIRNSFWSGFDVAFQAIFSFVRSIIFARLLMPKDFGVLSIAVVFSQFIMMFTNFGFTASVIYQKKIKSIDLSTIWWANLTVETLATLIMVAIALLSGKIVPSIEIRNVVLLLSIQFIMQSISSINLALLQRLFAFKKITIINIISSILSFFLTIFFIIKFNAGVYALVAGMILASFLKSILVFYYLPWLPSLNFSFESAKKHLSYGGWFFGVSIVGYINSVFDKTVIAGSLNTTQLGFFELAGRLPTILSSQVGMVLNKVMFSAFSNRQNNLNEVKSLLKNLIHFNAIILYPLLIGLVVIAKDFILAFYGSKWDKAIIPMQLLSIYGLIYIPVSPVRQLANGLGKSFLPFKWMTILMPFNIIITFLFINNWGIIGASSSKIFYPLFLLFTLEWELLKIVELRIVSLLVELIPALVSSIIMAIVIGIINIFILDTVGDPMIRLVINILLGAGIYIIVLRTFWAKDFYNIVNLIKKIYK